jgi:hypothetical protein
LSEALKARQIIQVKGMRFCRPCRGFSANCSSILGLRAALRRFTPGYCSISASSAQKTKSKWYWIPRELPFGTENIHHIYS